MLKRVACLVPTANVQLTRNIGSGEFGEVYLATARGIDTTEPVSSSDGRAGEHCSISFSCCFLASENAPL